MFIFCNIKNNLYTCLNFFLNKCIRVLLNTANLLSIVALGWPYVFFLLIVKDPLFFTYHPIVALPWKYLLYTPLSVLFIYLCFLCSNVNPALEPLSEIPLRLACSCCFFWFFSRAKSLALPPKKHKY